MPLYKDRGVVVSGFRLGEADKVLTILTEGRGIVRAVAKGVRKTKSRFGGRLEPLSHVALVVYEGRNLDVVNQVETITPYPSVREIPDRMATAFGAVEAASRTAHEKEPAPRLYRLVTAGLGGLEDLAPSVPVPPLYLTVFLLRLMDIAGLAFAVDQCAACGSPAVERVSVAEGGALCGSCVAPATYQIGPDTLPLLAFLSAGRVAETAARAGHHRAGDEAAAIVRRFVEYHLESRLRVPAVATRL